MAFAGRDGIARNSGAETPTASARTWVLMKSQINFFSQMTYAVGSSTALHVTAATRQTGDGDG